MLLLRQKKLIIIPEWISTIITTVCCFLVFIFYTSKYKKKSPPLINDSVHRAAFNRVRGKCEFFSNWLGHGSVCNVAGSAGPVIFQARHGSATNNEMQICGFQVYRFGAAEVDSGSSSFHSACTVHAGCTRYQTTPFGISFAHVSFICCAYFVK